MRPATRQALSSYRHADRGARIHTALRSAMAPLEALADLIPAQGSILDLGCGHGLFSIQLAIESAQRRLHGVDISTSKVDQARLAAAASGLGTRVAFELVEVGWTPTPDSYDTVVISDVLYLLDPEAVTDLVAVALAAVRPGGRLVIKEIDTSPRCKHAATMIQEFFSVRVMRITEGDSFNSRPLDQVRECLEAADQPFSEIPIHQGYPYAHVAIAIDRAPPPALSLHAAGDR